MCYYGIRDPPTDNHMNITEMNIKSQSVELLGIGNRIGIIILRKIEVGMRKLSYLRLKSIMRSSEDNKNDPRIRVTQLVFESDDEGEESNAVDDLSK
ncbi:hypothetical protein H109_06351 [Trichophyton interdigitale MR816]|uniref:Uncharacterized protein n=1 Tax=Trichophyton interdigitale (strain MR816) TaxID=1215338 RepID=A0A059J1K1_TRIIM|nr:hypothetical protein H109_06351 [Trichophyton interdigitale MR816]